MLFSFRKKYDKINMREKNSILTKRNNQLLAFLWKNDIIKVVKIEMS